MLRFPGTAHEERYRPDIDGLRAIAILAVLVYHLGFDLFRGGFVGVDIFFVISGYLITRLIRDEVLETGRFSYANFYIRRVRRLFPALFVTLTGSLIAGAIILAPQHLAEFGASLIHALMSMSNIYFWSQVSYFDTAAELKPLLHTWSLSVEEQFYLIWPPLLYLTLRGGLRHYTLPLLLLIGFISLWLNLVFAGGKVPLFQGAGWLAARFADGASSIFYLTPFRAFEFVAGAIVLWLPALRWNWLREGLLAVGLLMLAASLVLLSDTMIFPSYNALLPCLGAALAIYAGQARWVGLVLRNPLMVGIGLISYSLYLVHWPLIVFYKYKLDGPLGTADQAVIALLAVGSAMAMYAFVEQPFRRGFAIRGVPLSRPAFGLACAVLALLLIFPAANIWGTGGWLWRYPNNVAAQLEISNEEYNSYVGRNLQELHQPFSNTGKLKVAILGDSMTGDFVNELTESGMSDEIELRTLPINFNCQPILTADSSLYDSVAPTVADQCRSSVISIRKSPILTDADVVVLAGLWRSWALQYIASTVELLRKDGAKSVAIVGVKTQAVVGTKFLAQHGREPDFWNARFPPPWSTQATNAALAELAKEYGIGFYDPQRLFCDARGCPIALRGGALIFWDDRHLTQAGAKYLGDALRPAWRKLMSGLK